MKDLTFGSPNNQVILNQFLFAALQLLQDIPVQVQLQINDLITIEAVNVKKVYYFNTKSIKNDTYYLQARVKHNWLRFGIDIFGQQCAN